MEPRDPGKVEEENKLDVSLRWGSGDAESSASRDENDTDKQQASRDQNDKDNKQVSRDETRKEKQQVGPSSKSIRKRLDLTEFLAGLIADHQETLLGKREGQDQEEEKEDEEMVELDLGIDNDHQRQEDRTMPPKGIDMVLDGDQQGKKNKLFQCKQCGMQFVDHRSLGGHVASHTRKSTKQKEVDDSSRGKFKCVECLKCFSSKRGLSVHMTVKHCPMDHTSIASTSGSSRPPTPPSKKDVDDHPPSCQQFCLFGVNVAD